MWLHVTLIVVTRVLAVVSHFSISHNDSLSTVLNIGSPGALQAAFRAAKRTGSFNVVFAYNSTKSCDTGLEEFGIPLHAVFRNITLDISCVSYRELSLSQSATGLVVFVFPIKDGASVQWLADELFFNVSRVANIATIAVSSHDPREIAMGTCDATCVMASGPLYLPYIAQYYRIPYLMAAVEESLSRSLAIWITSALSAAPEAPLCPSTRYFRTSPTHPEAHTYISSFPSHLYMQLTTMTGAPMMMPGLVYFGPVHLHRIGALLRSSRSSHKTLTVVAVGSSFTFGVGLKDVKKQTFTSLVTQWLRDNKLQAKVVNVGRRGGGPSLFFMCGHKCVPQNVDILIMEFAVSHRHIEGAADALEDLIRRYANRVAIIIVGVFQQYKGYWFAQNNLIFALAHHYSIPVLSMRSVAFHSDVATNQMFKGASGHHFGPMGHRLIANGLTALFKFAETTALTPREVPLPPPLWGAKSNQREPTYYPGEELNVVYNVGWVLLNGTRPGWVASDVGSVVTFQLETANVTEVTVMHLTSFENIGNCSIWFDMDRQTQFLLPGVSAEQVSILQSTMFPVYWMAGHHNITINYTTAAHTLTPQFQYGFRVVGFGVR